MCLVSQSRSSKERKLRKARKELFNLDDALAKKEIAEDLQDINQGTYQGAGDGASQANKGSSVGYTTADDKRESFRGRYGQGGLASLL